MIKPPDLVLARFAADQLTKMKLLSPLSLRLTFLHLRDREVKMTLEEALASEQRMQTRSGWS